MLRSNVDSACDAFKSDASREGVYNSTAECESGESDELGRVDVQWRLNCGGDRPGVRETIRGHRGRGLEWWAGL